MRQDIYLMFYKNSLSYKNFHHQNIISIYRSLDLKKMSFHKKYKKRKFYLSLLYSFLCKTFLDMNSTIFMRA